VFLPTSIDASGWGGSLPAGLVEDGGGGLCLGRVLAQGAGAITALQKSLLNLTAPVSGLALAISQSPASSTRQCDKQGITLMILNMELHN